VGGGLAGRRPAPCSCHAGLGVLQHAGAVALGALAGAVPAQSPVRGCSTAGCAPECARSDCFATSARPPPPPPPSAAPTWRRGSTPVGPHLRVVVPAGDGGQVAQPIHSVKGGGKGEVAAVVGVDGVPCGSGLGLGLGVRWAGHPLQPPLRLALAAVWCARGGWKAAGAAAAWGGAWADAASRELFPAAAGGCEGPQRRGRGRRCKAPGSAAEMQLTQQSSLRPIPTAPQQCSSPNLSQGKPGLVMFEGMK
jgi:hypothetical protein